MDFDQELISRFLTGTMAVFALVAVGGALANVFRSAARRFAFTRAALIMALPPFCLAGCVDRAGLSTLFLFAIVIVVLGFTIDGLRNLTRAWRGEQDGAARPAAQPGPQERSMTWEKAE